MPRSRGQGNAVRPGKKGWIKAKVPRAHVIEDINFDGAGKVTCICGWEGVVYDIETGEESLDFSRHRGSRDRGRAERAAQRAD